MSFLNKLRRALGLDDDSIFENEPNTAVLNDDSDEARHDLPAPQAETTGRQAPPRARVEDSFNHVVAQFNEAMPDFLARSVDPELQKKLLYDNLDKGLKEYLAALETDADTRCEARWSNDQATLRTEMDSLRQKAEQIEQQRADIRERQLSADRQKRALSERLRDLENQVGRLEAEREQYDLENKSLLNKMKVIAVQNPDIDMNAIGDLPPLQSEELEALKAENARLQDELKQAADRHAIANELYNDEQRRLKAALRDVEDLKAITEQVEIVQKAIADRDQRIERQHENIRSLKDEIKSLKAAAATAAEQSARQIEELQKQLAERESAAAPQPHEEEFEEAPSMEAVEAVVAAPARAKKSTTRKRKPRAATREEVEAPRISDEDLEAIEAGFSGSEWFGTADPAPAGDRCEKPDKSDDFGYHAPEPKPRPYDDGMQMSLFD